jgi:UDP-glucuronate 4-epimerase
VDAVLVTGGLGFIGSRLCEALLDDGARVRCVDDLSGAYAPTTGPAAAARLAARGAEVLVTSADPGHVDGVDAVIHLAGRPGVRSTRPVAELHAANVEPAERLAAAAARTGARFLLVSSSSVYGNAAELPTPEHAPPAPLNGYAASKVAAEAAVLAGGGDPVVVRPFTVYGQGQRPDMAFARWIAALSAGEAIPWHAAPGTARDFTFVGDAVAGLIAALRRGRAGEAYNVSGGRTVPLAEALALLAGDEQVRLRELSASGGEALVTSGCGRKALAELGHSPRVGLEAGVERQLDAASSGLLAA